MVSAMSKGQSYTAKQRPHHKAPFHNTSNENALPGHGHYKGLPDDTAGVTSDCCCKTAGMIMLVGQRTPLEEAIYRRYNIAIKRGSLATRGHAASAMYIDTSRLGKARRAAGAYLLRGPIGKLRAPTSGTTSTMKQHSMHKNLRYKQQSRRLPFATETVRMLFTIRNWYCKGGWPQHQGMRANLVARAE